jgi:hypothetical protein
MHRKYNIINMQKLYKLCFNLYGRLDIVGIYFKC